MTLPVYLAVLALLCFAIAATSWVLKIGAGMSPNDIDGGIGAEHSGREPQDSGTVRPYLASSEPQLREQPSRPEREWVLERTSPAEVSEPMPLSDWRLARTRPYDREGESA